jgi:hypothetical protein
VEVQPENQAKAEMTAIGTVETGVVALAQLKQTIPELEAHQAVQILVDNHVGTDLQQHHRTKS